MTDAFPLAWPDGWKQTQANRRERSRFKTTFGAACKEIQAELGRMRAGNVVISTNVPLRRDGLPYATFARYAKEEPGAAVYFTLKGKQMVLACDRWLTVEENLHAICLTVDALRGIERWGASDMMQRAFDGFAKLPPVETPRSGRSWWEVLGVPPDADLYNCQLARRVLARQYHPDRSQGDAERMAEINAAVDERAAMERSARPAEAGRA